MFKLLFNVKKVMMIIMFRSFIVGLFIGVCYGIAFVGEKQRMLREALAAKGAPKRGVGWQMRLLSIRAIIRYSILVGIFALLIFSRWVVLYMVALSFLIGFWCVIFWLTRRRYEN